MTQIAENVKHYDVVSSLDIPGTGKFIILAMLQHKTTDVARLMELTGEERRTVQMYRRQWLVLMDETGENDEAGCANFAKIAKPVSCGDDGQSTSANIENARDYTETPSELSSIPQQQQAPDPIESGLLSLLKVEWNLYTDAEAKTALIGQFKAYGEKHVVDAYSSYLAESKSGRAFVKPWKYIQATAMKMRDAPQPTANVVPMQSRYPTSNSRIRARMLAEHAALEAQA